MKSNRPEYQSYVLRLWLVREEDRWEWRASLQPIPGGATRGFGDLTALYAFLEAQTGRRVSTQPASESAASQD